MTKIWTKEEVGKLSGRPLFDAAVEAGVYKPGMKPEEVRAALINPLGDIPDWANEDESPSKGLLNNLWRKLLEKLPTPISSFLEGIEADEVAILVMQFVDNARESKKYATKEETHQLKEEVRQVVEAFHLMSKAEETADPSDDEKAKEAWANVVLKWLKEPV
jgi:hypothetical protein